MAPQHFLAAAHRAPDVEGVRVVWRRARAAGEPRWYLDLVAAVGRAKAGAGRGQGGGRG